MRFCPWGRTIGWSSSTVWVARPAAFTGLYLCVEHTAQERAVEQQRVHVPADVRASPDSESLLARSVILGMTSSKSGP